MKNIDILIKNGQIIDGTSSKRFIANLAISGDRIFVVDNNTYKANTIIDAKGKIVCPGFIDIHSHSDYCPFLDEKIESKIMQGVTSEIVGNCGTSAFPIKNGFTSCEEYLNGVNEKRFASNIGTFIGHGTLRSYVMGNDLRDPSEEEMQKMEEIVDFAMQQGAFGLTLGLIYEPSSYSKRDELVRLAKVVAKHNGVLAVHMRDEGEKIFEAVEEVISIAEDSKVQLEISHFKITAKKLWNTSDKLFKLIEEARGRGIKVNSDQYPYCASQTRLKVLLPKEYTDGGLEKTLSRLNFNDTKLLRAIEKNIEKRGGANAIMINMSPNEEKYKGKYLSQIQKELDLSSSQSVIKILKDTSLEAMAIYFSMNEKDMLFFMKQQSNAVGSDACAQSYNSNRIFHPRAFGSFPKYLETIRLNKLMSFEEAIFKCTGLPSKILNLKDRGLLKQGYFADIVILDENKISSKADYKNEKILPEGIDLVIVNGKIVIKNNKSINLKVGREILH